MLRNACAMAAMVWLAATGAVSAQEVQTPERAIPDRYIIVLKEEPGGRSQVRPIAEALARQHGGRVTHVYEHTIRGFTVSMSATGAAALARHSRVRYIEVLEDCLGRKAQKNLLPLQLGDVPDTWADVEDLVTDVGYRPSTPVEVGVRNFVDWYLDYYKVKL